MDKKLLNKKKEEWVSNKYDLRRKENYEPWLSEREFSGQGALIFLKSCLFKRNHIVFSKLQEQVLLDLLYQKDVLDIREHYPILSVGGDSVICTTFLITRRNEENGVIDEAIGVLREVTNHSKKRIRIQENYWNEREVIYKVITEKDLKGQENKFYNQKLFYQTKCNTLAFQGFKEDKDFKELYSIISNYKEIKLSEVLKEYQGIEKLKRIEYVKYMIAHDLIKIDWQKKFNLDCPVCTVD